jgi:hypothetical protein
VADVDAEQLPSDPIYFFSEVVAWAAVKPDSALDSYLEWDDTRGRHAYRLEEAPASWLPAWSLSSRSTRSGGCWHAFRFSHPASCSAM